MLEDSQYIQFTIEDRVGRIALARPPVNVLDIAMMREIDRALNACMSEREMVAVVFESGAEARAFSAGMLQFDHDHDLETDAPNH